MFSQFHKIYEQMQVLVAKDLAQKYKRTILGFLWSFLLPLTQSIVLFYVFRIVMRFNMPNYILYLVSGLFLWQTFNNMLMSSLFAYIGNAALLKRTSCIRYVPVVSCCITELVHLCCSIPVIMLCMWFFKVPITFGVCLLPLFFIILTGYGAGIGMLLGVYNLFFRDIERIVIILLQLWFFVTPVFYPVIAMPQKFKVLLWVNPFYPFLELSRAVFFQPMPLNWQNLAISLGWMVFFVILGSVCYLRNYRKLGEYL